MWQKGSINLRKFDYGPETNLIKYKQREPPEYDLESIKEKVFMFSGREDLLATPKNVKLLRYFLKSSVLYEYELGHGGFLWGYEMDYLKDLIEVIEGRELD